MKHLVTGGAGFIGSHLVDRLVKDGHEVVVIDNLSGGRKEFLDNVISKIKFHELDILEDDISDAFMGVEMVWHLAANPDVRIDDESVHMRQNFDATRKILDAMVKNNVSNMAFTSSSTVYGNAIKAMNDAGTKEDSNLNPTSHYGIAKLASENLIKDYSSHGINARIFRLANVIGPRSTHGVIFDFIKKLKADSKQLEILGDGKQTKSYIYISDCIDAITMANQKLWGKTDIFNIGSEDWINVKDIADIICEKINVNPEYIFTGGSGGWKGDVPLMLLDIKKIKSIGFDPKYSSLEAVEKTTEALLSEL